MKINDNANEVTPKELQNSLHINNEDAINEDLVEVYVYPKGDKIALTYTDGRTVIYKNVFGTYGFPTVVR